MPRFARFAALPLVHGVLALLAGLVQAYSIATPWNGAPNAALSLLALAALAWLVDRETSVRRGALWGWLFGTAWLAGTFWWLFISMHVYGGLAAPLAVLAVLGLAAFLALYYGAACGAFVALAPARRTHRALLFIALWLLAELARGSWFTGFPWGAGGYAQLDGPLAPAAKFIGVYGLGAAALLLAWQIVNWLQRPREVRRALGLLLVVPFAVLAAWGTHSFSRPVGTLEVALLQGNIPQDEKFQPGSGVPLALAWYGQQLQASTAPLVVAPETAIPVLLRQLPPGYWDAVNQRFRERGQAALIGVPLGDGQEGYSNSVVGLKPGAPPYRYDKHHLVPFGEFIPPLFKWFVEMMDIPLGDFNRGAVGQPSFEWPPAAGERKTQRLAPNVCYEDLFGEELGARFVDAARAPTVLVNVSNIAWFGDSIAIDQHLAISRMRALEFERPMLRATNTGATALIDHEGRVLQELPRLTRGVLSGEVEGREGTTPYAWWVGRFGLWPLWLLGLSGVAAAAWQRRRRGSAIA